MDKLKKILITGASGYLGANITRIFSLNTQYEVVAIDRDFPPVWKIFFPNVEIIQGDLTQKATQQKLFEHQFDGIVHTISLDHRDSEKNEIQKVIDVNLQITWELLHYFSQYEPQKFIYLSTIQVLGKLPISTVDENYPRNSQNRYALTHGWCEDLVNYYNNKNSDFQGITLRLSNGYGNPIFHENNCWWLVVNDLCRMAMQEQKITLLSDGSPMRDFVHVQDIARAVFHLMNLENTESLYHISSENTQSMLELAFIVKKVYETHHQIKVPIYHSKSILVDSAQQIQQKYKVKSQKLRKTGFEPSISLEEGIRQLFIYLDKIN